MTNAHGVARDQLRAFVERIERLEEEKKTIADDIRDVLGEAKSMGFCTKTLKKIVALRKKDENERAEEEAILDVYKMALGMIPQLDMFEDDAPKAKSPAMALQSPRKAAEAVSERTATYSPEQASEVPAQDGEGTGLGESLSGKSDTARPASVDAQPNGRGSAGQTEESVVTVVGTESGTVSSPKVLDGRSPVAGESRHHCDVSEDEAGQTLTGNQFPSDDDAFAAVNGKAGLENVADVEPSSSAPIAPASHGEAEAPSAEREPTGNVASDNIRAAANTGGDHVDPDHSHAATAGTRINHIVPDTSGITFEECPPKPMRSLPFAHCFPELTKSEYGYLSALIEENGVEEPIIRSGDIIIDGWNRYNIARSLGIAYPVKQFEGGDILSFVIAAQRSARDWLPSQERKIAAALCKELPHRANDIMAAFQIEEEFA